MVRNDLRNVAIIAHVDHGKTTLVDAMLRQSGAFRDNQVVAERVMDSGDIERERGITILAKNCSCTYKGVKINIVDTPGHADFGGEVERVLKMVNGVLLLVDAAEGCMPQTRFVLQKALQQNLSLVVAINKIDRPDARIKEVIDEVLYLLMDLGATDEQLDCPMLFCCGRDGTASLDPDVPGTDLIPLFDTLLSTIKPPEGDPEAPFQMLVSSVDYNDFVGRIGIGRIQNGVAKVGEEVVVCDWHNQDLKMRGRLTKLYDFQANGRQPCDNITAGDIVAFSGLPDVTIGNTLCSPSNVEPLPFVKINDPTVEMTFSVNDSPLAGREGKYVTSRQIRDRLQKELLKDVALKVSFSAKYDYCNPMYYVINGREENYGIVKMDDDGTSGKTLIPGDLVFAGPAIKTNDSWFDANNEPNYTVTCDADWVKSITPDTKTWAEYDITVLKVVCDPLPEGVSGRKCELHVQSKTCKSTYPIEVLQGDATAGINGVTVNVARDGKTYNLSGQRVAPDTKGIVIRDGKKYVNK